MLHHCHGVGGGMAAVQPNTTTCKAKTPSQKPKEVHRNKGTPEGFPLQELTDAQSQAVNFALSRRVDRLFLSPYRHSVGCRSPPLLRFLSIFKNSETEEIKLKTINLRDYYPFYQQDIFLDVPDEVFNIFEEYRKAEQAYQSRIRYHKAYYSLDRDDGIEHSALFVSLSPDEIYERKLTREQLHAAIVTLPDKQAKRIYAHYFLGMSKAAIAKAEGVSEAAVRVGIEKALINLEKIFKKSF